MDILSFRSFTKSRSIKLRSKSQSLEFGSLVWKFDPDHHYLHPKLMNWLYSKWILGLVAVAIVPMFFLSAFPIWIGVTYNLVAVVFLWIPFLFLTILSFNRDAGGFIVKSSEFWIKIIYGVAAPVLRIIRYHYVVRYESWVECSSPLGYTMHVADLVVEPLLLIVVGGSDAIPSMEHKWKAILMGMVALHYSILAIEYQFLEPHENDFIIRIKSTRSEVSFQSMLSNVCGMLAIFLWKQAIDVIRNKDRCISITYRPHLKWERSTNSAPFGDLDGRILDSVDSDKVSVGLETCAPTDVDTKT